MPKTQRGFKLPKDVSVRKERQSGAWVYVFRHTQLGNLGRIVLQGRPDGRTHVTCEVAGDPDDPMTEVQKKEKRNNARWQRNAT